MLKEVKLNNISPEEIVDIANKDVFIKAVNLLNDLPVKMQENIEETSTNDKQKLDDGIIKTDGENDYVRWN